MVPKGKKFFYEVCDEDGNLIATRTSNKDTYRYAIVVEGYDYRNSTYKSYENKDIEMRDEPGILGFRTNYPTLDALSESFYIYKIATIKNRR